MKVRAKKLAVLMLAGMLVLSGLGQTGVVNAEETTEQTESTLTQGDKKEEQTNSSGENKEETEGKEEKTEVSGTENSTSDIEDSEEKTIQNQSAASVKPNNMQAKQAPAEDGVVSLTQGDTAIGNYPSIAEALKNVKDYSYSTNKTEYVITLQKDINEDVVIPAKKKIAIDLNGFKITNVSSHTIYNNSTKIRIIDQKGDGVVDNITHGKAAVYNNIKANITLSGGSFTRSKEASTGDSASGGNSFYVLKNFGTMTINKGVTVKFSDTNCGLFSSLIGNGWQDAVAAEAGTNGEPKPSEGNKNATLKIEGGNLYGGQITVKNDDYGNLTVSGGTIVQPSEGRAAIANNHIAEIKGGQIEAQGENGQAVYSRYFDTKGANKGELTISGGTFKSTGTVIQAQKGSVLSVTNGTFETSGEDSYIFDVQDNVTSSIKNGTYKGVIADKVANKKEAFAEGYAPQQDKFGNIVVDVTEESASAVIISRDGTEKKYVKAQDAGKALQDGETLKFLKDYVSTADYDWGISISAADVTVDLNGHSVTSNKETTADSNGYAIKFKKPASGAKNHTVTIKNSGNKQSVLKSSRYQIYAQSGDSKYNVIVKLEGDIVLKDTNSSEEASGIMLDTGAKLLDTETARRLVPNGGFSVKEADGNNYIYGDYANALDRSVDKYVLMLNDYTTNSQIASGDEDGTLDLGGNIYTYTGSNSVIAVNYPNVELTIKNGKILTTNESCDGAHLIGAPNVSQMNNRSLILDKVELTVPGEVYGIVTNGSETGNKVVLKDSVLNVKEGYGIYFPSTGSVTIDNSVINAKYTGVQMCAGDLTVTGDKTKIHVTGTPQEKTEGDGPIADGAAISVIERDGYKDLGKVSIEDGTFKAAQGVEAVQAYKFDKINKVQKWEEAGDVVDVTGGSFSTVVPENICGDKFIPTEIDPDTGLATVKKDTKAPEVSLVNGGKYYGGKVTFTVKDDNEVASVTVNGSEVTVADGVYTIDQAGKYTVEAKDGVGNTTKVEIEVIADKGLISKDTAKVTLINKLVANGKEQTQEIEVVVDGVVLTEGVDYEVTGNKATKAGTYTLKVTGIGNYEGSVEVDYVVAEKDTVVDPSEPTKPQKPDTPDTTDKSDKTNGKNNQAGAVKTGDTANVAGYLSILVLAAGVVVLAISRKRRTK